MIIDNYGVFADGDAVYSITREGDLLWHDLNTASKKRSCSEGKPLARRMSKKVSTSRGWKNYKFVFSSNDGQGIIYLVTQDGRLFWNQHLGHRNGDPTWRFNGMGKKIGGNGWANYKKVFANGDGTIYAIKSNGDLVWYRHHGYLDGRNTWENNGNEKLIGTGWQIYNIVTGVGFGGRIIGAKGSYWKLYQHQARLNGDKNWSSKTFRIYRDSLYVHWFGSDKYLYTIDNEGFLWGRNVTPEMKAKVCKLKGGFQNYAKLQ